LIETRSGIKYPRILQDQQLHGLQHARLIPPLRRLPMKIAPDRSTSARQSVDSGG
jgi:hypothetical protein